MLYLNYAVNHCSLSMKFAFWHPLYFHTSALFFSLLFTFERLLRRSPSCFLHVLITELWQMFPRLIWDGRRQPSVLRTARSHLCVQWSAKPCSDIRHPSTRPRIQGMYQICQRAWHINACSHHWSPRDVIPLSVTFGYWLMCLPIWFHHRPEEITTLWDLNLCWFLAGHYCPATMLQNWIFQQEKWGVKSCIYLSPNVCLMNCILLVVMHYCFYIEQLQTFSVLLLDEVCLWIVYSLSFPFMFLTFCH